jgi:hypothetical protein
MGTFAISLFSLRMGVQERLRGRNMIRFTIHPIHALHHMAFLSSRQFLHVSSCGCLFVPSRRAVKLWHCQWLPLGEAHYPHSHFSSFSRHSIFAFCCIPTKTILLVYVHYYCSLDHPKILSCYSGVGTCIQRQPVLVCRYRTYPTACTNELLDLCITFINE